MKYSPLANVVLFQPEIPHNTGAIGRTCVAVAAKLWLVRPLGFHIDDYYLRRAGLDYWEYLEWQVVDDWATLERELAGRTFYYFSKTASRDYTDVAYQTDDVLVFGNESKGLPESMLAANTDRAIRIPMRSQVRCLNLSNAAAIVLYEALRQHG